MHKTYASDPRPLPSNQRHVPGVIHDEDNKQTHKTAITVEEKQPQTTFSHGEKDMQTRRCAPATMSLCVMTSTGTATLCDTREANAPPKKLDMPAAPASVPVIRYAGAYIADFTISRFVRYTCPINVPLSESSSNHSFQTPAQTPESFYVMALPKQIYGGSKQPVVRAKGVTPTDCHQDLWDL